MTSKLQITISRARAGDPAAAAEPKPEPSRKRPEPARTYHIDPAHGDDTNDGLMDMMGEELSRSYLALRKDEAGRYKSMSLEEEVAEALSRC